MKLESCDRTIWKGLSLYVESSLLPMQVLPLGSITDFKAAEVHVWFIFRIQEVLELLNS